MKRFKFTWKTGVVDEGEGVDAAHAFSNLGYGRTSVPSLKSVEELTSIELAPALLSRTLPDDLEDQRELAERLHEALCRQDHTEQCDWYYHHWNDVHGYAKERFLKMAIDILEGTSLETALDVVNTISRHK